MSEIIMAIGFTLLLAYLIRYFELKMRRHEKYIVSQMPSLVNIVRKVLHKVLVVDDDELQVELIRQKLIPIGCKVHQAATKHEALALIHDNRYDLIFLDIRLAGENGSSVLKTMRANNDETSVVIVTGYADSNTYQLGAELDAPIIEKQHLTKDIDIWSKIFLKPS